MMLCTIWIYGYTYIPSITSTHIEWKRLDGHKRRHTYGELAFVYFNVVSMRLFVGFSDLTVKIIGFSYTN